MNPAACPITIRGRRPGMLPFLLALVVWLSLTVISRGLKRTKGGKERSGVGHANISIYTYTKTSFFDEKSLTFCHSNCGSQKTLRALQNSDLSPRLGDSGQSEPKPTGQLALDAKS